MSVQYFVKPVDQYAISGEVVYVVVRIFDVEKGVRHFLQAVRLHAVLVAERFERIVYPYSLRRTDRRVSLSKDLLIILKIPIYERRYFRVTMFYRSNDDTC